METNPAGEAIDGALSPMPKMKAHLRALPYQEVQGGAGSCGIVPSLGIRQAVPPVPDSDCGPLRRGEGRNAWDEIDEQGQEWRIPSQRMKAGMEHRVPLSSQTLDTLREASALRDESRPGVPVAAEAGFANCRHDADEGSPIGGAGGASDRPRVPQQLQELDA